MGALTFLKIGAERPHLGAPVRRLDRHGAPVLADLEAEHGGGAGTHEVELPLVLFAFEILRHQIVIDRRDGLNELFAPFLCGFNKVSGNFSRLETCALCLVVPDKAERVASYHRNTLKALAQMLAAAGLDHPDQLAPHHLVRRVSSTEVKLFSQIHYFVAPGDLLGGGEPSPFYADSWRMARADSFDPLRA